MPRRRARPQQTQAKYDAAGNGRRVASWRPPASGPNRATQGLQTIRNRARDVARNDWAGESALQKWTTNLIGTGIVPRWKDERFTKRFAKWVPTSDADGVLDFYGQQTLATRAWLDGGEVFGRRRPRLYVTKDAAPIKVQLIEAEFCPLFDADTWPDLPQGNIIRQGIELDKRGERVAFRFYREHPGDALGAAPTADRLVRVLARDVIHVFEQKRPGQLRGVSQLAPVLVRLRSSMDMEDAVLDRQKLANLFTLFITQEMPPDTADIDYDPLTGLPTFFDDANKALVGLEPGISQKLAPGEDVKFANPPEAGTTYSDYMRTTHQGTAAGAGLPYELFSGNITDVSDRTLRVVMNEFRRFARQRQWQILIPQFCQRVVEWWAEAEVLAGTLPLSALEAAKAPKWSPNGWEPIHPTQDAEGKKIEVDAGFRSRSDVMSERGDDPATVDAEREEDLKRSKKLGLEPPVKPPKPAPAPTAREQETFALTTRVFDLVAARAATPPPPAPVDRTLDVLAAMAADRELAREQFAAQQAANAAQFAQFAALLATAVSREVPTPVVENHTHVEPTPVQNVVNVGPTPIENHNHVDTVVNVTPKVEVELPDREIKSVIERDPVTGQITDVTQTETTLQ